MCNVIQSYTGISLILFYTNNMIYDDNANLIPEFSLTRKFFIGSLKIDVLRKFCISSILGDLALLLPGNVYV